MKQIKRLSSTLAVLTLALVFVAGPAFAAPVTDGSTSDSTAETKPDDAATTKRSSSPPKAEATATEAELNKRGESAVAELRKERANVKVKSAEQQKKTCEARKKGLQTKFASIVRNSERAQARISSILDKSVAFQQTSNVAAADVDALVLTAMEAKVKSAASIEALKAVTPNLTDCGKGSVATDVATFKVAAQTTRTDLKDYKMATKAVLKALQEAKPAENTTTEGSN